MEHCFQILEAVAKGNGSNYRLLQNPKSARLSTMGGATSARPTKTHFGERVRTATGAFWYYSLVDAAALAQHPAHASPDDDALKSLRQGLGVRRFGVGRR